MSEPIVNARQLKELLESEFTCGRSFTLTVTGHSMRPFLHHLADKVVLCAPERRPPAVGEIVLFYRGNGTCVLHRIVGERKDGSFAVCGDAQTQVETVRREQIAAVVYGIIQHGQHIPCDSLMYRLRAGAWEKLRPVRGVFIALDTAAYRAVQKIRRKRQR